MFGKNPFREVIKEYTGSLAVKSIIRTFRGEEPFSGIPVVLLTLGGCNLACGFCDTDFESFSSMNLQDIINEVNALSLNEDGEKVRKLVVITGGEPFRQPIEVLCQELLLLGFNVLIETNGTIYRNIDPRCHIVISPKNNNGYINLRDDILRRAVAIKFIISMTYPGYQEVPDLGQSRYNIPVYVQPMDELNIIKNLNNLKYALEIAAKRGYYYSIQTQKIIGIS